MTATRAPEPARLGSLDTAPRPGETAGRHRGGRFGLHGTAWDLLRGAGGSFAIKVAAVGAGLVVQLILARVLGTSGYGDYIYALTFQNVLLVVATFGFDTSALRFVAVYRGAERWGALRGFVRRSHQLVAAAGGATAIVAIAIVAALSRQLRPELVTALVVAFLILPINALLQLESFSLLGLRRVLLAQAPRDVLRPLLLGGAVWFMAVVANREVSATSAMILNLVTTLPALVLTGWGLRRLAAPATCRARPEFHTREWGTVAAPLFAIAGLQLLLERVDVLLLGAMLSTRDVAVYSVAGRIAGLMLIGLSAVNAIAAPMIASLHAAGNRDELQRTVTTAVRGVLGFALPTTAVLILGGRHVLALFGPEYVAGFGILAILTVGAVLNITSGLSGFLMTMTGHQRQAAWIIGGSVALSVAMNVVLIPLWGQTGAATATVTALLMRNVVLTHYVRRSLGIRMWPLAAAPAAAT